MPSRLIAFDWDDTLVEQSSQEWLEGAQEMLRAACERYEVCIHSCRANWPQGLASIRSALDEAGFEQVEIVEGKPYAWLYVDDRALRFEGDWSPLQALLEEEPEEERQLASGGLVGTVPVLLHEGFVLNRAQLRRLGEVGFDPRVLLFTHPSARRRRLRLLELELELGHRRQITGARA